MNYCLFLKTTLLDTYMFWIFVIAPEFIVGTANIFKTFIYITELGWVQNMILSDFV